MSFTTERLLLERLQTTDIIFIRELLNTEGWIRFIGNRNINSDEDALAYIQKIQANDAIQYFTVRLKTNAQPVGLVTLIQRTYLSHPDIGFAFLPAYNGMGYAYEASKALLDRIVNENKYSTILATTIPENKNSIRLLTKLGLQFEKELKVENDLLHVYKIVKIEDVVQ